jgi:roadblock/LC7 domain-containing protein
MRIKTVQLSATEVANIVNGFEENSMLPQNGLFIGGAKYMVLQGDQGVVIRGKKVTISSIFVNNILKRFEISRYILNLSYFVYACLAEV